LDLKEATSQRKVRLDAPDTPSPYDEFMGVRNLIYVSALPDEEEAK
jgi:hypothetical protein